MNIGILGGFGFLGKNLDPILSQDHKIFLASRRSGIDAKNTQILIDWMTENKLDCVVNLAANCGGIGLNQKNPADLWLETTLISAAVLEASRIFGLKKLIMIGTVCSYAKNCPTPFHESHLMHHGFPEETNAGYGGSKLNAFFGCQSYKKQYGLNVIYLIPVNLYGKYDNFNPSSSHVIPALIDKIIEAKENKNDSIVVWGDGTATREFLYAEDCARAIKLAIENYNEINPVNIGSSQEISIMDLVNILKNLIGYDGQILWDSSKPNGQPKRKLDTKLAAEKLGFTAKTSLEDGLRKTIEWRILDRKNK